MTKSTLAIQAANPAIIQDPQILAMMGITKNNRVQDDRILTPLSFAAIWTIYFSTFLRDSHRPSLWTKVISERTILESPIIAWNPVLVCGRSEMATRGGAPE